MDEILWRYFWQNEKDFLLNNDEKVIFFYEKVFLFYPWNNVTQHLCTKHVFGRLFNSPESMKSLISFVLCYFYGPLLSLILQSYSLNACNNEIPKLKNTKKIFNFASSVKNRKGLSFWGVRWGLESAFKRYIYFIQTGQANGNCQTRRAQPY